VFSVAKALMILIIIKNIGVQCYHKRLSSLSYHVQFRVNFDEYARISLYRIDNFKYLFRFTYYDTKSIMVKFTFEFFDFVQVLCSM